VDFTSYSLSAISGKVKTLHQILKSSGQSTLAFWEKLAKDGGLGAKEALKII